jgi:hypothetical protein
VITFIRIERSNERNYGFTAVADGRAMQAVLGKEAIDLVV